MGKDGKRETTTTLINDVYKKTPLVTVINADSEQARGGGGGRSDETEMESKIVKNVVFFSVRYSIFLYAETIVSMPPFQIFFVGIDKTVVVMQYFFKFYFFVKFLL